MTKTNTDCRIEELLYVGNKKAKQLRDRRRELIEYLFEGGSKPEWVEYPQWRSCERVCELIDEHNLDLAGDEESLDSAYVHKDDVAVLDGFFDYSDLEEVRSLVLFDDDWVDDDGVVHTALIEAEYGSYMQDLVDDWSDSLHKQLFIMKCDIDAFYCVKSAWVCENLKPSGVHEFDGFRCVLFAGKRFGFHVPVDDVCGDFDLDRLSELGKLDTLHSNIEIESDYSDLSLNDIAGLIGGLL